MEVTIDATTVQILTALTALIAVIVGPIVTVRVAKWQERVAQDQIESSRLNATEQLRASVQTAEKQIRAMTVSVARREWNDQLRKSLADYLAATRQLTTRVGPVPLPQAEFQGYMERINAAFMSVSLLLNPHESAHMDLLSAFNPVWDSVISIQVAATGSDYLAVWPKLHAEIGTRVGSLIHCARAVLKREWEKVKSGD
jgi:hypothetical protein